MDRRELLNDEQEALRMAMEGQLSSLWTAMPAIVQKVDYTKRTCEVQPTIQGRVQDSNGEFQFVNLPLLVDVPIVMPSAGGFTLSLPIKSGDEVLIIFASRCIDSWWQSGGVGQPMELRMHDLSDGFAIPGPRSLPTSTPLHSTNARLTKDDGSVYVELTENKVNIKAPTEIKVEAPLVTVQSADIQLKGNTTVTGNLTVSGTTTANSVTAPTVVGSTSVTSGGKNFNTHVHSGVQTGINNTGAPV